MLEPNEYGIVERFSYHSILLVLEAYTGHFWVHFWVHFNSYCAFKIQEEALLWLGCMTANKNASPNVLLNKPVPTPIHSIKSDDVPAFLNSFKRDMFMLADDHRWMELWGVDNCQYVKVKVKSIKK